MGRIEYLLSRARLLAGFVLLAGCSTAPMPVHPVTPPVFSRPLIPSPPGGGCLPFASLVPPYPHQPETARVADVLLRAGYVIVKVEHGRTAWRCGRAAVRPLGMQRGPAQELALVRVAPEPAQARVVPEAPKPGGESARSASASPDDEPTGFIDIPANVPSRALAESLLPERIKDRAAWVADLIGAFDALTLPPTVEHLCATMAVIGQESGFQVDPVVPELNRIVWREIGKRREAFHIPRFMIDAAMEMRSPNGRTYKARIDAVRTERELSAIYDDFMTHVPLGSRLFGHLNPVRTLGSMQVGIDFIEAYARQRPFPSGGDGNLRAIAFSRYGSIYFGTAHLLDYAALYDTPIYRFADYNAGRYASRNAALQNAVARLSGIRLHLDGVLLANNAQGHVTGETLRAALSLGAQLQLDQTQIVSDLQLQRSADLESSAFYRRVYQLADDHAGKPLPRALLPQIKLAGPKIQRSHLTTEWFARRVDSRYQACLARGTADSPEAYGQADKAFMVGW